MVMRSAPTIATRQRAWLLLLCFEGVATHYNDKKSFKLRGPMQSTHPFSGSFVGPRRALPIYCQHRAFVEKRNGLDKQINCEVRQSLLQAHDSIFQSKEMQLHLSVILDVVWICQETGSSVK